MARVEARCTQCGSKEFGTASENTNTKSYDVPVHKLKHGTGKQFGTERLECPACGEVTVHNRAGASVPNPER